MFRQSDLIYPRVSKILGATMLLLHGCTLVMLQFLPLQYGIIFLLSVLCLISLLHILRTQVLLWSPKAIVGLFHNSETWVLQQRDGSLHQARLCGDSFVSNLFVILNFKLNSCRYSKPVVISRDALTQEKFRRLLVWLKI